MRKPYTPALALDPHKLTRVECWTKPYQVVNRWLEGEITTAEAVSVCRMMLPSNSESNFYWYADRTSEWTNPLTGFSRLLSGEINAMVASLIGVELPELTVTPIPRARFWIWRNETYVKVSIGYGDTIEFNHFERHDEGFLSSWDGYRHDGDRVVYETHNRSSDCDGLFESSSESHALLADLRSVEPYERIACNESLSAPRHPEFDTRTEYDRARLATLDELQSFESVFSDVMLPSWESGESQRDHRAESMGY